MEISGDDFAAVVHPGDAVALAHLFDCRCLLVVEFVLCVCVFFGVHQVEVVVVAARQQGTSVVGRRQGEFVKNRLVFHHLA